MGGVSVESGGGGRRSLDSEINMIPMIDLLMCLICFLLITAVWSTMARINANAQVPSDKTDPLPPKEPPKMLHVSISEEKFVLAWKQSGTVLTTPLDVDKKPLTVGKGDNASVKYPDLATKITEEWKKNGQHREATEKEYDQAVLHCDNGTKYKEIVAVIDAINAPQRAFPGSKGKPLPAINVTFAMR
jgi:biopolymer transport protein ExbD